MGLLDAKEYDVATVLAPTAVPGVPLLQSPANGATGVSLPVTLIWQPSANAASYRVQVAIDNLFSQIAFDQANINTNSVNVTGLEVNTRYFWRVKDSNQMGDSDWSAVWSFTTASADMWGGLMSMVALMMVMGMMSGMMSKEGDYK